MKKLLAHTDGEKIELFLFIKRVTRAIATSGKPYLTIVLQDKSGELEGRLWDVYPGAEEALVAGTIVFLNGEIQMYKGKAQVKISRIRLKTDEEDIKIGDLVPAAPVSQDEMAERISNYINEIQNSDIQKITKTLYEKYHAQFLSYPAATKNHHEFVSGLAYHVVSMLDLAKAIAGLYPTLNKDLLYAGVILHDMGKVNELSGPTATQYTIEGNLIGHISMISSDITRVACELNIEGESVMLLQHMVLSHHGKGEWGSPKVPMIREAEMLHYIDNIDAKMNMMDRALEHVRPGNFSERIFALENRSIYKPLEEI